MHTSVMFCCVQFRFYANKFDQKNADVTGSSLPVPPVKHEIDRSFVAGCHPLSHHWSVKKQGRIVKNDHFRFLHRRDSGLALPLLCYVRYLPMAELVRSDCRTNDGFHRNIVLLFDTHGCLAGISASAGDLRLSYRLKHVTIKQDTFLSERAIEREQYGMMQRNGS